MLSLHVQGSDDELNRVNSRVDTRTHIPDFEENPYIVADRAAHAHQSDTDEDNNDAGFQFSTTHQISQINFKFSIFNFFCQGDGLDRVNSRVKYEKMHRVQSNPYVVRDGDQIF